MSSHEDKYRWLALNITYYRKLRNWSQQELADRIPMSRGHLSHIEAPKISRSFSMETFFDIADALGVEPGQLFDFSRVKAQDEKEVKDEL